LSIDVRQCPADTACLGGDDTTEYCEAGHEGPYCGVCSDGYSVAGTSVAEMKCELCDGDTSGTIALMVGGPFVLLLAGLLMYFCCSCCKADDEKDDNRALALADDLGEGRGRSLSRGMSSMSVAVAKKTKRAASIFALLNAPFRILLA
jgi:hypothetical protein